MDRASVVPSSAFSFADRIPKVRVTAKARRAWNLKVNRQSFPKNMTMKDQTVRLKRIREVQIQLTYVKAAAARRSFGLAS